MKNAQQLVAEAKSQIREVTVPQLATALQNPHSILIDVREPDEFSAGHIHGAVNYPRGVLEMRIHQHPAVAAICDTDQAAVPAQRWQLCPCNRWVLPKYIPSLAVFRPGKTPLCLLSCNSKTVKKAAL